MKTFLDRRTFLKGAGVLLALPWIGRTSPLFAEELNPDFTPLNPKERLPVLLYHDISDYISDAYTVAASQFAAQMEWLYSNGYQAVSLARLRQASLPKKAVAITFDDGYASFMDFAFPLLQEYHFKATINIIGNHVGSYLSMTGNRPLLSWDEYRFLAASGVVDLGCHTDNLHAYHHRGVLEIPDKKLKEDLEHFQQTMILETGKPTEIIAWPYGFYSKRSLKIALQAGFRYILTSNRGILGPEHALTEIPRISIGNDMDFKTFKSLLNQG